MERQAAGKDRGAFIAALEFKELRRHRPRVITHVAGAVHAAKQNRALIPPGEARAVVSMPGITFDWFGRLNFDAHFENWPAHPEAEALAERGQRFILLVDQSPFTHDLRHRRPARGHAHL